MIEVTSSMGVQFGLWTVFAVVWLAMMPKSRKDKTFVRKSNYNGSLYVTMPISLLLWVFKLGAVAPWFPGQEWVGAGVTAFGLGVALYARWVLGHYWDIHAAGRKDGTFLEVFPYSHVRHPIYGAQLVMCLGTALTACNLAVFVTFVVGSYGMLLHRAKHEEALLNETTDGAYGERFFRKGRFFPRLSSSKRS